MVFLYILANICYYIISEGINYIYYLQLLQYFVILNQFKPNKPHKIIIQHFFFINFMFMDYFNSIHIIIENYCFIQILVVFLINCIIFNHN